MKIKILTIATILLAPMLTSGQQICKEPFISEMVEANGQNRALELFNPSDSIIDLSAFSVRIFMNGQLTPLVIPLIGNLPPKSTFVIAHPAAGNDIKAKADMLHSNMSFDGNDAVVLEKTGGTQVDKIGEVGVDPGQSGWMIPPNGSTKDNDLRRKEQIGRGETDWSKGKNQWEVHPKDSVSNLKKHENICKTAIEVNFVITASSFPESATGINLELELSQADPNNFVQVWVDHYPFSETCIDPYDPLKEATLDDYDVQGGDIITVTWVPGEDGVKSIVINFIDDNIDELDEFLCFEINEFFSDVPAGANDKHKMTIEDNDVTGISVVDVARVKVYPSVVQEHIYITGINDVNDVRISIQNLVGQEVLSVTPAQNGKIQVNVSDLAEGMYLLKLYDKNTEIVRKFVKK